MLPATNATLRRSKEFTGRASRSQIDAGSTRYGGESHPRPPGGSSAIRHPLPPPRVWVEKNRADGRFKRSRAAVTAVSIEPTSRWRTFSPPNSARVSWSPPEPVTAETVRRRSASSARVPGRLTQPLRVICQRSLCAVDQNARRPGQAACVEESRIPGVQRASLSCDGLMPDIAGRQRSYTVVERQEVVFVDGVRTPFGRAGESRYWNTHRADDLIVKAIIGLIERNPELPTDHRRRRDRRHHSRLATRV